MIAATLLLLAQAAPAAAPVTPPVSPQVADARCVAAFGILGTDAKDDVVRAAQMGALFFYGKLLGRDPAIDLPAAMVAATGSARGNQKAELARCGAELQRSGEAMQAVGQAMSDAGPPPAATPVPAPTPLPAPTRRK